MPHGEDAPDVYRDAGAAVLDGRLVAPVVTKREVAVGLTLNTVEEAVEQLCTVVAVDPFW
jgi:hypothetical protein